MGKVPQLATGPLHHLFILWYNAVDTKTKQSLLHLDAVFLCRKHSLALVPNLSRMQTTMCKA